MGGERAPRRRIALRWVAAICPGLLRPGRLSRRFAGPVRPVLQVAASLVFRILWIWAERTCETFRARPQHLLGSDTVFHPFLQGADGVERIDAGAATAMAHARRHEQAHPVALILAHLVQHGDVVPNRGFG